MRYPVKACTTAVQHMCDTFRHLHHLVRNMLCYPPPSRISLCRNRSLQSVFAIDACMLARPRLRLAPLYYSPAQLVAMALTTHQLAMRHAMACWPTGLLNNRDTVSSCSTVLVTRQGMIQLDRSSCRSADLDLQRALTSQSLCQYLLVLNVTTCSPNDY